MTDNKQRIIGFTCVCAILLSAGCKSARYEKEAEGLAYEETISSVAAKGIPGGGVVDTLMVQAKVLDISYKKREVKLLIPGGSVLKTKVDEAAVNFDQVKKGDIVNAVITEELIFQLASSEAELKDHAEVIAVLSEEGEMPAGIIAAAARVTATITSIDVESHTVKLTFKDGTTKTVPVREDVGMDAAKVGDQIVIDMFEAVVISINHPEAKK